MSLYENLLDLVEQIQRPKPEAVRINVNLPTNNLASRLQNDITPLPSVASTRYPTQPFVPVPQFNKSAWRPDSQIHIQRTEIDPNDAAPVENTRQRTKKERIEAIHREQAANVTADLTNALYVGNIR